MASKDSKPKYSNPPPLKVVVEDMIEVIIERNHHHISTTLSRGLQIDMKRDDDLFTLLLSREKMYPSALEWDIVTRFIPRIFIQDQEELEELEQSNRHWLRAKYRIPNAEVKVGKVKGKLVLTSKTGDTTVELHEQDSGGSA